MKLNAQSIISVLIGLIITFGVIQVAIPKVNSALTNLTTATGTSLPFYSFFTANGLVLLIIMAGILLGVVYALMGKGNK
jgi:cell division protein FtsX